MQTSIFQSSCFGGESQSWIENIVIRWKKRQHYDRFEGNKGVIRRHTKKQDELMHSYRINSSFATCSTSRVSLVTNSVISHDWGKIGLWLRQTELIRGHLWHNYDDFNLTTSNPSISSCLVSSNPLSRNWW